MDNNQMVCITKQNPDNHTHHAICSPLCACNCCQAQVLNSPVQYYKPVVDFPSYQKKYNFFNIGFSYSFFGAIWQPPQLS